MNRANVGPIDDEGVVYGACRPGHLGAGLSAWTETLAANGVTHVLCLLSETEAARWGLPGGYEDAFETAHVPIRDRELPDDETLERAVGVLASATAEGDGVAIHCNAGLGRTGVVGAGWLVYDHGYDPAAAIEAVESRRVPRSPREAVREGTATDARLHELLAGVATR